MVRAWRGADKSGKRDHVSVSEGPASFSLGVESSGQLPPKEY